MISVEDLLAIRDVCARRVKAHDLDIPNDYVIEWLRSDAMRLADGLFATAKEEVAALFFVFSRDAFRLRTIANQMAPRVARYQMVESRLTLSKAGRESLLDLRDKIMADDAKWDETRAWFEERLRPK